MHTGREPSDLWAPSIAPRETATQTSGSSYHRPTANPPCRTLVHTTIVALTPHLFSPTFKLHGLPLRGPCNTPGGHISGTWPITWISPNCRPCPCSLLPHDPFPHRLVNPPSAHITSGAHLKILVSSAAFQERLQAWWELGHTVKLLRNPWDIIPTWYLSNAASYHRNLGFGDPCAIPNSRRANIYL